MKPLPTVPISFEEFLDWCDEDTRAEWVNGRVVLMSPASSPHQRIGSFLEVLLRLYVEKHDLGEVFRAPFLMHLGRSAREPDILYLTPQKRTNIEHTYLDGPADLAVEIMAPDSIKRDRVEKFNEYAKAGIREYWLINPMRETANFFELTSGHRYRPIAVEEGIFRSRLVDGFYLRIEWLWKTTLRTEDVLREIGAISQ